MNLLNREYSKRRAKGIREETIEQLHEKKLKYNIPPYYKLIKVPEKELAWVISCAITQTFAVKTVEEVYIDSKNRNRVDIYIPQYRMAIEVKVDNRRSKGSRPGETPKQQLARYRRCSMVDKAYLVSVDGSIGLTIEELMGALKIDFAR